MTKTNLKNKGNGVVSGLWKFNETITPLELAALAQEWADADTDGNYIDLHVRKCSKDQYGIGFKYILGHDLEEGSKEKYNEFFNRMTDLLKKKYGNLFVGWDVSSFTHIII